MHTLKSGASVRTSAAQIPRSVAARRNGWSRYVQPSRLTTTLQRFPVTFAVLVPYVALILPLAIWNQNPSIGYIVGIGSIAVASCFTIELLTGPRSGRRYPSTNAVEYGRGIYKLAVASIIVSSAVSVLAAYSGKGSVAAQIGLVDGSGPISTLDSLVGGWGILAIGLLLTAYLGDQCSRRELFGNILVLVVGNLAEVYFTGRTAPQLEMITFLATILLLLGVIRVRVALVALVVVLVVWPTTFELRNQLRMEAGVTVDANVSAFDRIRFDEQIARAEVLEPPVTVDYDGVLQHPGVFEFLRFGLVPRVLDPDRKLVSTGLVLNVALGGSTTSAFTFLPVTNTYVLEGPVFLVIWYAALALFVLAVWRNGKSITPMRMMVLALVLSGPLGWFSTYPDRVIGVLQSLVSGIPLFVAVAMIHARSARRRRSVNEVE